jgi:hypothetical protein
VELDLHAALALMVWQSGLGEVSPVLSYLFILWCLGRNFMFKSKCKNSHVTNISVSTSVYVKSMPVKTHTHTHTHTHTTIYSVVIVLMWMLTAATKTELLVLKLNTVVIKSYILVLCWDLEMHIATYLRIYIWKWLAYFKGSDNYCGVI